MNLANRVRYAMGLAYKAPKSKINIILSYVKVEFDDQHCLVSQSRPNATMVLENKIKVSQNAAIFRFSTYK